MSDFISVFCSIVSLVVTIYIGWRQIKQGQQMDEFSRKQDIRDESRYKQDVDTKVTAFIVKYHDVIGYLPLCFIASLYDSRKPYCRAMYTEFNLLSHDVQDAILASQGIVLPRFDGNLYQTCYDVFIDLLQEKYPSMLNYKSAFLYGNGKYFERSIKRYAGRPLQVFCNVADMNFITDTLLLQIRDNDIDDAVFRIYNKYDIVNCDECLCCEVITTVVKWIAVYSNNCDDDSYEYWIPPYGSEQIETLEDLFLLALFCIYVKVYLLHKSN